MDIRLALPVGQARLNFSFKCLFQKKVVLERRKESPEMVALLKYFGRCPRRNSGLKLFVARLDEQSEEQRRQEPEAVPIGEFERYLTDTFRLDGEVVVRRWNRRPLKFHRGTGGYRFAEVTFRSGWVKSVMEHRLKFLLAHGWLPRTVDHIDRDRANNALANLRASTPALQAANSERRRRKADIELLPIWEIGYSLTCRRAR
jgi:HNH endonuclease